MKKILVYVDAENVSKEILHEEIIKIKNSMLEQEQLIGKFYGNKDVLNNMLGECYRLGLDYVETSSIVMNRKNVTDMKIAVDAITDALITYRGEVASVYLVSRDYDFVPLAYKLIGNGINVILPVAGCSSPEKTSADLDMELRNLHFSPLEIDGLFDNLYKKIKSLVSAEFSDTLIKTFLDRKRRKFVRELASVLSGDTLSGIARLSIEEFSFKACLPIMCVHPCDTLMFTILDAYTRKFFGITLTQDIAMGKLGEITNEISFSK